MTSITSTLPSRNIKNNSKATHKKEDSSIKSLQLKAQKFGEATEEKRLDKDMQTLSSNLSSKNMELVTSGLEMFIEKIKEKDASKRISLAFSTHQVNILNKCKADPKALLLYMKAIYAVLHTTHPNHEECRDFIANHVFLLHIDLDEKTPLETIQLWLDIGEVLTKSCVNNNAEMLSLTRLYTDSILNYFARHDKFVQEEDRCFSILTNIMENTQNVCFQIDISMQLKFIFRYILTSSNNVSVRVKEGVCEAILKHLEVEGDVERDEDGEDESSDKIPFISASLLSLITRDIKTKTGESLETCVKILKLVMSENSLMKEDEDIQEQYETLMKDEEIKKICMEM